MSSDNADLTARARIRNAALAEFAEHGYTKATLRAVATAAGVSPALVPHHFGSKEGLLAACDEHLFATLRSLKASAIAEGRSASTVDHLRADPKLHTLYAYLRRRLLDGGEMATSLFDDLTDDVASYLDLGEKAGTVRPYADREARAAVMTAMSLGLMVFDERVAARLGGGSLLDEDVVRRYSDFVLDLYAHGLLVDFVVDPPTEEKA